ncbi:YihY/virulence factor BrkB family protein [Pseudoruegeria sp. HB172150]|uniref:YihY/virulence factor BrkB family protein n=1 Tax=Pseudoruegeria sp. HB172150 TaxID=2721164 RepID=UPI0015531304|nr:YihY/virulence factor BrkB family protein [Pseudoruegeria sp. HB172150]
MQKAVRPTWRVISGVFSAIGERNLDLISAGVAFWGVLAIFPAVAAVIALWGFWFDPHVIEEQMGLLETFIPNEAYKLLNDQVTALIATNNSTLGWTTIISTGFAIWSTRAGVGALLRGLNAAYGVESRKGFWPMLWAVLMTIILVAVAFFALASVVVVPIVLQFLPLGDSTQSVLSLARWLLTGTVMLLTLSLVYRYGPNHRGRRPRWLSAGAVLALAIWAIASAGFTIYLSNFGNYNQVYGSIGAVIALLMWFWISAYTVLFGAAVNAEIDMVQPAGST